MRSRSYDLSFTRCTVVIWMATTAFFTPAVNAQTELPPTDDHFRAAARLHTEVVQAVLSNAAVIRRAIPASERASLRNDRSRLLRRVASIETLPDSIRGLILIAIPAMERADREIQGLRTQDRAIWQLFMALDGARDARSMIDTLRRGLERPGLRADPRARQSVALAIAILEDGLGTIYDPAWIRAALRRNGIPLPRGGEQGVAANVKDVAKEDVKGGGAGCLAGGKLGVPGGIWGMAGGCLAGGAVVGAGASLFEAVWQFIFD